MIDGSRSSQLMACERVLIWTKKHNCPMAQGCLHASIKYHERMLEKDVEIFLSNHEVYESDRKTHLNAMYAVYGKTCNSVTN